MTPDPGQFSFLPLGIGNAFTRRYFNSSLLLFAGGRQILVDCPAPIRRVLADAGTRAHMELDLPDIDHILLTHLHGDHANGLEEVGFFRKYSPGAGPPHLYILPELLDDLWEHKLRAVMGPKKIPQTPDPAPRTLETYFHPHTVEENREHRLAGGDLPDFRFEIRRTLHFVPCYALRMRFKGVSLGYSADTTFDPGLIDFLRPCDTIIHEMSDSPGHTRYEELMTLPPELRAKMLLIHIPDTFDRRDSEIRILEEGRVYNAATGS